MAEPNDELDRLIADVWDRLRSAYLASKPKTTMPSIPADTGPPKCWKCGAVKVWDLFKGEHCRRCDDWV